MPEKNSQVLGLKDKDVFLETKINDTKYFSISGLPTTLSYGKHPFAITFNDPTEEPLLKNLSNIIFEFVDSRGIVIFSDLVDISELSGAGNGFVWIKKDPLRTADEIADGPAYLYVMGELSGDDIPIDWRGLYNVRSTFVYDIRKDYPNTSPLILKSPNDIQTNLNISESIEFAETQGKRIGKSVLVVEDNESAQDVYNQLIQAAPDQFKAKDITGQDGFIVGDVIVINKDIAGKSGAISVGSHELLHGVLAKHLKQIGEEGARALIKDFRKRRKSRS